MLLFLPLLVQLIAAVSFPSDSVFDYFVNPYSSGATDISGLNLTFTCGSTTIPNCEQRCSADMQCSGFFYQQTLAATAAGCAASCQFFQIDFFDNPNYTASVRPEDATYFKQGQIINYIAKSAVSTTFLVIQSSTTVTVLPSTVSSTTSTSASPKPTTTSTTTTSASPTPTTTSTTTTSASPTTTTTSTTTTSASPAPTSAQVAPISSTTASTPTSHYEQVKADCDRLYDSGTDNDACVACGMDPSQCSTTTSTSTTTTTTSTSTAATPTSISACSEYGISSANYAICAKSILDARFIFLYAIVLNHTNDLANEDNSFTTKLKHFYKLQQASSGNYFNDSTCNNANSLYAAEEFTFALTEFKANPMANRTINGNFYFELYDACTSKSSTTPNAFPPFIIPKDNTTTDNDLKNSAYTVLTSLPAYMDVLMVAQYVSDLFGTIGNAQTHGGVLTVGGLSTRISDTTCPA